MSITDELREWASIEVPYKYGQELLAIANRIDAEHEAACAEAYGNGVMSVPIALDESQWVKLPVDADGVPIHVGDVMEPKGSGLLFGEASFEVRSMRCDECGWEVYDRLGDRYASSLLRHHHEPTVEDVLREFAANIADVLGGDDFKLDDNDELYAEYAAKLRLAEREDA